MVQSPSWEADWFAASQEIPRISRNPKVHYRNHKRPPPVPILGQPNPVHIPTSHLLETHPNIIHPSTPRSPQWSPSLRFPHKDPIHPLSSPIRATCPAHLILLDFITRKILGEEYELRILIEYKKVKEKRSRYRSGVAQRVGRGVALIFHDCGTRKGWVISSTPRPHFTPGKDLVPILQEAGWASGPVWTGGKCRPHWDSIPDRPARSQLLYWLSYRAHINWT